MRSILFLFCSLFLVSALSAADISFEAVDSDGNTVIGTVTVFDTDRIVLDSDGTKTEIPMEKLVKLQSLFENPFITINSATDEMPGHSSIDIRNGSNRISQSKTRAEIAQLQRLQNLSSAKNTKNSENSDKAEPVYPDSVSVLELKDGTRLVVTDFMVKGQSASCRLLNNEELTLPLHQLLAVRLAVKGRAEVAAPSEDWRKLVTQTEKGDRIVVGQPGSLDVYVGIFAEVGKETISFLVDNETLPVPRRKVFGLLFHTPENAQTSESLPLFGSLTLWDGTTALLHSLQYSLQWNKNGNENGKWSWTTVSGISGTLQSEEIDELDLGRKNAFYLTDLKPALLEQVFFFDQAGLPNVSAKTETLTLLRTFRTNRMISKVADQVKILPTQSRTDSRQKNIPDYPIPGLEGFILEGISYEHGLAISAKTVLEYTLTEPFTEFRAVAGIDDRLRPDGAARLRIEADQQLLGDWEFRGDEPAKPVKLAIPPGTKTLKFNVDFTKGITIPDILTLADPKLMK